MAVLKKNHMSKKKSDGSCNSMLLKRIVAFLLILFSSSFLVTELVLFGVYILPTVCLMLFQSTGIMLEPGLLAGKFAVQDLCVMFMMWIVPCIFIIGISIYGHCKLIKHVMRRVIAWTKLLFSRKQIKDEKGV